MLTVSRFTENTKSYLHAIAQKWKFSETRSSLYSNTQYLQFFSSRDSFTHIFSVSSSLLFKFLRLNAQDGICQCFLSFLLLSLFSWTQKRIETLSQSSSSLTYFSFSLFLKMFREEKWQTKIKIFLRRMYFSLSLFTSLLPLRSLFLQYFSRSWFWIFSNLIISL